LDENVANGLVEYDGSDEEAHVVGEDEERGGIGGSFVEQEMQRDLFLRASFFISAVDLISQKFQMPSVTRDSCMTWTNKGKCSDLSGGNQADGNFRLPSNHYHLELTYSLVSDSNMDLPPMVTPTKSGTPDTLSTICPRSLRMTSTAPTTAVLKCQAVWIKYMN
jgi:hypothetical protein